jgi:hypothetical protein
LAVRSKQAYKKLKRQKTAEKHLGIIRNRLLSDKALLRAMRAVLLIQPTHKLLKMPSPVKKSTKHVVIPSKVFNYDANPALVSQAAKVRTIYAEASEEIAQFALGLSLDDQKLLGVQTIKVEWTQEAALHFLWRMRQWYEWVLASWEAAGRNHIRFVELLTTVPEYGGKSVSSAKPKREKEVKTPKHDAMNHVVVSFDTLAGWEYM